MIDNTEQDSKEEWAERKRRMVRSEEEGEERTRKKEDIAAQRRTKTGSVGQRGRAGEIYEWGE